MDELGNNPVSIPDHTSASLTVSNQNSSACEVNRVCCSSLSRWPTPPDYHPRCKQFHYTREDAPGLTCRQTDRQGIQRGKTAASLKSGAGARKTLGPYPRDAVFRRVSEVFYVGKIDLLGDGGVQQNQFLPRWSSQVV